MAFSTKLEFFKTRNYSPTLVIEPNWWDKSQLRKNYPFITETNFIYSDYFLEITLDKLDKIHKEQLVNLNKGVFECDEWQKLLKLIVKKIERILASKTKYELIRVVIYEWESGY